MYPDGLPNGSDVELLDTRPPRPGRRRWEVLAAVVVAAAAVTLVVVRSRGDDGGSRSSRTPAPSTVTAPSRSVPGSIVPGPDDQGVVVSAELPFARMADTVYAIDAGDLITVDLDTRRRIVWPNGGVLRASRYAFLADEPAHLLWLVAATETRTSVEFLDPINLAVTGQHDARGQFMDAAVLDGRLYLLTTAGVSVISQGAEPRQLRAPAMSGQPLAVAADLSRHRILIVSAGTRALRLYSWTPGRHRFDTSVPAPIGKGDLVAAAGRIWAAGFGAQHGVLARLDPGTLRAVRHSPVEQEVGVGAVIVDVGRRHLLVRSGGSLGDGSGGGASDMWCIDAGTGAITRHWSPAAGTAVLTDAGVVLLAPGHPLQRMPSGACRG